MTENSKQLKLPICTTPLICSECWTYYKLAIIQAYEYGEEWVALNMNCFYEANGNLFFGKDGKIYPVDHFISAIESKCFDCQDIDEEHIIDFIISEIDKGHYILTYANFRYLGDSPNKEPWYHELLIHGVRQSTKRILFAIEHSWNFLRRNRRV